jgi:hypothetical protein
VGLVLRPTSAVWFNRDFVNIDFCSSKKVERRTARLSLFRKSKEGRKYRECCWYGALAHAYICSHIPVGCFCSATSDFLSNTHTFDAPENHLVPLKTTSTVCPQYSCSYPSSSCPFAAFPLLSLLPGHLILATYTAFITAPPIIY